MTTPPLEPARPGIRARLARILAGVIEGLLLVMVCLAPWALGAVEPIFQFSMYAGVALATVLWGLRLLLDGVLRWKKDPVALALAALFGLGIYQLAPLPPALLSRLAPRTAELYDQLLPDRPEVIAGEEALAAPRTAGASLSLYPGATRRELLYVLAIFLAYVVARNNCCNADAFRRLSVVLVVNGCLLALFAVVQFVSSPRDTVYWSIHTPGAVFGPFISRTHFPAYVNVCIGAAVGLLLSIGPPRDLRGRSLLGDPRRLWLGCAAALMVGATALSLARGGFLALLGGTVLILLLRPMRARRAQWQAPTMGAAALALGLVAWIGLERVEKRAATLWTGQALHESRWPVWADSWPLVKEFLGCGAGLGTYRYVERLHHLHVGPNLYHVHAHSEPLEALIEGGLIRLGISLVGIGLVFGYGWRAVARHGSRPEAGLALGGLFGFATLVIHSLGDFGIHLPAIALLAALTCAQLVALGQTREAEAAADDTSQYTLRLWGLAPLGGFIMALALAWTLCAEGWRLTLVHSLRLQGQGLEGKLDPDTRVRRLAILEEAVRIAPDNAGVHGEAADAWLLHYHASLAELDKGRLPLQTAALVLVMNPTNDALAAASTCAAAVWAADRAWEQSASAERQRLRRASLTAALRHYVAARDLCPLLPRPHIQLAGHVLYFDQSDSALAYLDRAKLLVTNDPDLWYLFGIQEYLHRQRYRACASWRRSLEMSDKHLHDILDLGRWLTSEEIARLALPDRPDMLLAAAMHLYPEPGAVAERRPFLERALALLEEPATPRNGARLYLMAQCLQNLGQAQEAQDAYQKALALEPRNVAYRVKYAAYLRDLGQVAEARGVLRQALAIDPSHPDALALLEKMTQSPPKPLPEVLPIPEPAPERKLAQ